MADDKPKRLYCQVTYFYPNHRPTQEPFTYETFLVDEAAGGRLREAFSGVDLIVSCERGPEITVQPGWLWKEKLYVMRQEVAMITAPPPANAVAFPTPPGAGSPASTPPGTAPPPML